MSTSTPKITVAPTPPVAPDPNDLWFNSENGFLFIWYVDPDTQQWVVANPGAGKEGPSGPEGPPGTATVIGGTGISSVGAPDAIVSVTDTLPVGGGAQNLNTEYIVPTLAALKALTTRPPTVTTQGYLSAGDRGAGPQWDWVAGSAAAVDDFMVVAPTGAPAGRYIRRLSYAQAVSPLWAGCGLGATDDSAQFVKVIAYAVVNARTIDLSGGTYPVSNLGNIGNGCPGIFSDGSGKLVPAPGSTTTTIGMSVTAADFFVDNIQIVLPVNPEDGTAPAYNYMIGFANVANARHRVSDCRIIGGTRGLVFSGGSGSRVVVARNMISGVYGQAIACDQPYNTLIVDNQIEQCGNQSPLPSGVIRIGDLTQTVSIENIVIARNVIKNCMAGTGQEAIDISSSGLRNCKIDNNIIFNTGNGGIEMKAQGIDPAGPYTKYQHIEVTNNLINMASSAGQGIAMNNANGTAAQGKLGDVLVAGNLIFNEPLNTSSHGIDIAGYENVLIVGNRVWNVQRGITIGPNAGASQTAKNIELMSNSIVANEFAILLNTAFAVDGLRLFNNFVQSLTATALCINGGGTVSKLEVKAGRYETLGAGAPAIEFRNINGGFVTEVTAVGGTNAIVMQAGPSTDLWIERCHLRCASSAPISADVGVSLYFNDNLMDGPDSSVQVAGAAPWVGSNKVRARFASPVGVLGGSVGTICPNGAPAAGGFASWICTTAGGPGAAVWKTANPVSA